MLVVSDQVVVNTLQGLRRWSLATRDAHDLYKKFGFTPLQSPDRMMEIHRPEVYRQSPSNLTEGALFDL